MPAIQQNFSIPAGDAMDVNFDVDLGQRSGVDIQGNATIGIDLDGEPSRDVSGDWKN